jgi:AAA15 family ATPase/GTPase
LSDAYRFFSKRLFWIPQHPEMDEWVLHQLETNFLKKEASFIKNGLISLIKATDTGISDMYEEKGIKTVHKVFDQNQVVGTAIFNLSEESEGTQKLLSVATSIFIALHEGDIIIIDELNKDLHPLLTRMLIQLFQQNITNPNNAQLICSTHDVSLIDQDLFRRDQIYIVDKTIAGASTIGRISDFKGVSKVVPLAKWYMKGLFKGTPAINEYEIDLKFEPYE